MSPAPAVILCACILAAAQAQPLFKDVTAASGIPALKYSEGVTVSDFDGDGLPELYLPDVKGPDKLYKNLGRLRFKDITKTSGISVSGGIGAVVFDLDGDGHKDIYVVRGAYPYGLNVLYMGLDGGGFTDVSQAAGVVNKKNGIAPSIGDYDLDGDPDIFIANWGPDTLYRNDSKPGRPAFDDVSEVSGIVAVGRSWSGVFSDFNGDANPDLFVARGGPGTDDTCRLYINHGGTLVDETERSGLAGVSGMGALSCDFDLDGDMDIFVTSFDGPDRLFINDGTGHFTDKTPGSGITSSKSVGAAAGDMDGDLLPDIAVAGFARPVHLYKNLGGGRFADVGKSCGIGRQKKNEGVALADLDGDGDLDLYVANYDGHNALYRNGLNPKRYLRVRPVRFGREAVGAHIGLYRSGRLIATSECQSGSGFCTQVPAEALFALPDDGPYDLRVVFPGGAPVEKKDVGPGDVVIECPVEKTVHDQDKGSGL
jgi:enediyne biosynthesis protein E4